MHRDHHREWQRGAALITCDPARTDVDAVHRYLSNASHWAGNIPCHGVERSMAHSIPFTVFVDDPFAGFARVTTDRATVAYLGDVFVPPAHRTRGLSKCLVEWVLAHPDLQGLRRFLLATVDAHGLYAQYGFTLMKGPEKWKEIHCPDAYTT
jgi:GNAT superfamily N-acetyltransferase